MRKESEGEDKDKDKQSNSEDPEAGPSAPKKQKVSAKLRMIEIY